MQNKFSTEIRATVEIVHTVGDKIELLSRNPKKLSVTTKLDAGYQHNATSTSADMHSQKLILRALRIKFPDAHILTEEKAGNEDLRSHLITRGTLSYMFNGCTFGVDPIDGTSEFKNGLYEWALSLGVMRDAVHIGGAIFAPSIRGGVLVAGERQKGVFLSENGRRPQRVSVSSRIGKEAVVYMGCDFHWLKGFTAFEKTFAPTVNRTKSIGSCAVGLAMVAAGKVDAIIQPVQKPWDWFAGYPLVEEAGGKFQFYHYRQGKIESLSRPDMASYNPERPNVAFIAGVPTLVDYLFETLQNTYQV